MTTPLQGALTSLRTSTNLLDSSLSILDAGTSDLPRLANVLSQTRHFELLPSATLSSAQDALLQELEPEVQALISRVEAYVEKLERREKGLAAKWELQEGRLGRETGASGQRSRISSEVTTSGGEDKSSGIPQSKALGPMEELKVKQLRAKKQRLSYAVDRLQLQAQNAERNLRKSMAIQEAQQIELTGASAADVDGADNDDVEF